MSNKCPYFIAHCTDTDLPYFAYFECLLSRHSEFISIRIDVRTRAFISRARNGNGVSTRKKIYIDGILKGKTKQQHQPPTRNIGITFQFGADFFFCFVYFASFFLSLVVRFGAFGWEASELNEDFLGRPFGIL